MDTVESLRTDIEFLKSIVNSLSAKIDITTVGLGKLHGVFEQVREDILELAQDYDNGR